MLIAMCCYAWLSQGAFVNTDIGKVVLYNGHKPPHTTLHRYAPFKASDGHRALMMLA